MAETVWIRASGSTPGEEHPLEVQGVDDFRTVHLRCDANLTMSVRGEEFRAFIAAAKAGEYDHILPPEKIF